MHRRHRGKIGIASKVEIKDKKDLSLVYTPGVGAVSEEIAKDPEKAFSYTAKGSMVAVVTDGSAVLGLGNIGPEAALPIMEGKCALFKRFGGVDAFPICLNTQDADEIVETVKRISPAFGGINLEDISAPRCFEIEERLLEELSIPVFHDDQHGTAIIVLAALINALKLVHKGKDVRIAISGAGAAGITVAKMLYAYGFSEIIVCDRKGTIYKGRKDHMNHAKMGIANITNKAGIAGSLADAMRGSDVFIGVSSGGIVSGEMVRSMAKRPVVFAMANPVPEIMPNDALEAGAAVVATGRSDFPNQINNVLVFPGIFKGMLKARCRTTDKIKIAVSEAIAGMVRPRHDKIIPDVFDNVADVVSKAVVREANRERQEA